MSTPRALTLADQCDQEDAFEVACARELRRLHAENEDFRAACDHLTRENAEHIGEIVALKEQRDELLKALKTLTAYLGKTATHTSDLEAVWDAEKVIGKATGETK